MHANFGRYSFMGAGRCLDLLFVEGIGLISKVRISSK